MTQARGFFKTVRGIFEDTFGTTPAVSSGDMIQLPFNDFQIGSSEDMIDPQTIRGNRYQAEPSYGNISVQGNAVIPLEVRSIGYWIKLLMGSPTTTGSGTYTHVFSPGNSNPSMTMEQGFSDITVYQYFTGCKVNSMSLQFAKGQELVANIDILGKDETTGSSSLDAYAEELVFDRFNAKEISLKKGGDAITTISSLTVNISNDLDQSIYTIDGTGFRHSLPETNFMVDGEFTVLFEDLDIYNEAIANTETSFQVTLTNGSYSLVVDIYEVQFARTPVDSAGAAPVTLTFPYRAYYQDNAQGVPIKMTLVNDVSSYA